MASGCGKANGWRWVPVLAAMVGVLAGARGPGRAAAAVVDDDDAHWRPGQEMLQAVGRVMIGARKAHDDAGYGYMSGTCFLATYLKPGQESAMAFTLEEGESYVFLGGGDDDAKDVDIVVTDADGDAVAKDTDRDATPVTSFQPRRTGKYVVHLKLFDARVGCFCAVALLKKGGYNVPVQHLADATDNLLKWCEQIVKKVGGAKFSSGRGGWSIYGAVLKPGEDSTITKLDPGRASIIYCSAGDTDALDVDLYLLDDDQDVLKKDTDADPTPYVRYETRADRNYGLSTKCVKTDGGSPALILTAALVTAGG